MKSCGRVSVGVLSAHPAASIPTPGRGRRRHRPGTRGATTNRDHPLSAACRGVTAIFLVGRRDRSAQPHFPTKLETFRRVPVISVADQPQRRKCISCGKSFPAATPRATCSASCARVFGQRARDAGGVGVTRDRCSRCSRPVYRGVASASAIVCQRCRSVARAALVRTCPGCGREFTAPRSRSRFCSRRCAASNAATARNRSINR